MRKEKNVLHGDNKMITSCQIKAARALLSWEMNDLAKHSGLSRQSISNVENGHTRREGTIEKISEAFNKHGIEFTENDGVRRKPTGIESFDGQERFGTFMAFLLNYLKENGGDVCVSLNDERVFQKHIPNIEDFRRDMIKLDKDGRITGRILAAEGNFKRTWADLRRAPKTSQITPVSFYIFGDNFALVSFANDTPHVELHRSSPFAEGYRQMFNLAWESAEQL